MHQFHKTIKAFLFLSLMFIAPYLQASQKINTTFSNLAESAVDKALRAGSYETIKLLLEHKAPLNVKKMLRYALGKSDVELVKMVIPYFDIKNERYCKENMTAEEFKQLASRMDESCHSYLYYDKGRELINNQPGRLLHECLYNLIDSGWDDASDFERRHKKGLQNVDAMFSILLEAGADINAIDPYGDTPFLFALKKLKKASRQRNYYYQADSATKMLLDILLKHGSNVNAHTSDGKTSIDILNEWISEDHGNCIVNIGYPQYILEYILLHGGRVEDTLAWKVAAEKHVKAESLKIEPVPFDIDSVLFYEETKKIVHACEKTWQDSLALVSFYLVQDALKERAQEQEVDDSSADIVEHVLAQYLL